MDKKQSLQPFCGKMLFKKKPENMIFKSRGNPHYLLNALYWQIFSYAIFALFNLFIGTFLLTEVIFGGLFWILASGTIIFIKIRKILKLFRARKIVELEVREEEIRIVYFQNHVLLKEIFVPRKGLKTYFSRRAHVGSRGFPSLRFSHPEKGVFFLEAVLGLWRKETVREIKESLKHMYDFEFWH